MPSFTDLTLNFYSLCWIVFVFRGRLALGVKCYITLHGKGVLKNWHFSLYNMWTAPYYMYEQKM